MELTTTQSSEAGIPDTGGPESEAWFCQTAALQILTGDFGSLSLTVFCEVWFLIVPTP